jgi:antitoxin ParD1/3/4
MNVSLGDSFDRFVASLVESGEYQSQSEVIREGLRLLKEREELRAMKLEEIRRQVAVGLEQIRRGEVAPLDLEAIKREGRKRLAAERAKKE